jgi:MFS family permease
MIRRIVLQYYLLSLLTRAGVNIIAATYVTFLLSKGLNLFEVNLVNMVFFVSLFLCEIPTGAFADVFGRKASFVLSCFLLMGSMLTYTYSETFTSFAIAETLGALGATFASGAFDAWLVDSLKHRGYTKSVRPIFVRALQLKHGCGLFIALLGAVLAEISLTLPWLVGAAFFFTGGILAQYMMKEEYFIREKFSVTDGWKRIRGVVSSSVKYGVRNKNIRFIMLLVLGLNFATMAPNMQWQPFFKQWLPNLSSFGLIWASMALSMMFGAFLAPRIMQKMVTERKVLLLSYIVIAFGLIGSATIGIFPASLTLFCIHEIARGVFEPIKETYLHDNIPSKERATVISFGSIAHHLGGAVGLLVSGLIALNGSIQLAWICSGLSLVVITLLLRKDR